MTMRTIGAVFLAMFSLTLSAYAGVYKWVDEKGNVHYSERPPKTGGHTQLHAQPALGDPQSAAESAARLRQAEVDKSERMRIEALEQRLETERQIRERDMGISEEGQRQAEAKTARDEATVAECNRNREIYCDQGVERIKREEDLRRSEHELERYRAGVPIR
ncbi:MAG TPA: DUF4124 domain-containing protein [Sideroxyarcus sp.]|nr:DUF4124 domain-containing protein [Sideroxyarcus sp.]